MTACVFIIWRVLEALDDHDQDFRGQIRQTRTADWPARKIRDLGFKGCLLLLETLSHVFPAILLGQGGLFFSQRSLARGWMGAFLPLYLAYLLIDHLLKALKTAKFLTDRDQIWQGFRAGPLFVVRRVRREWRLHLHGTLVHEALVGLNFEGEMSKQSGA